MKWAFGLCAVLLCVSPYPAKAEPMRRFLLSKVLYTRYLWDEFLYGESKLSSAPSRPRKKRKKKTNGARVFKIGGSWRKFLNDPRPYFPLISEASSRTGVPESVLAAVAACESSFLPNAVSHAGALGLMQIMPQNFKLLQVRDPFNPRQSVMGGARFLRRVYLRTGSWRGALASYHCGLGCWRRNQVPRITHKYIRCAFRQYRFFKKNGPWRS